jgi:hypothetical protein
MRKPTTKRTVARKATPSPNAKALVSLPLDNPIVQSMQLACAECTGLPPIELHVYPHVVQVWTPSAERPLLSVTTERAEKATHLVGAAKALFDGYTRTGFAVTVRHFATDGTEVAA